MDQCGHQPVDEDQLVAGAGSRGPLPGPTSCSMATTLDPGMPRHRQLLDQEREMTPRDPREQPTRQHRPINHDRHNRIMPPARNDTSPTITHQLVTGPPASLSRRNKLGRVRVSHTPAGRALRGGARPHQHFTSQALLRVGHRIRFEPQPRIARSYLEEVVHRQNARPYCQREVQRYMQRPVDMSFPR
jgi:hypothetical protein